jgi:PAS domain S-box-containing protein
MVPENSTEDFLFQPDIMYSIWTSVSIPVMVVRENDLTILEANTPAKKTFSDLYADLNGKKIEDLGLWTENQDFMVFLDKFRDDLRIDNYELCMKVGKDRSADFLINSDTMNVAGVRYKLLMMRNITELKIAERAAKAKELLYESAFNKLNEVVIIQDNEKIIFGNESFKKTFGIHGDEHLGRQRQAYIRLPLYDDISKPGVKDKFGTNKSGLPNEIKIDLADGSVKYYTFNSLPINYTDHEVLMTILIDITGRKAFEQGMMAKALESVERERNLLVESLHDDLGPDLSTIRLLLSSIDELAKNQEPFATRMAQCLSYIDGVILKLKSIAADITPDLVDRFGLHSSLVALIDRMISGKSLLVNFKSNIQNVRFSSKVEINIYRVISELIENTVKHSGASQADLKISYDFGELSVVYMDNGKGFDVGGISPGDSGSGILNMINRVNSLNGKIDFKQHEENVITLIKVNAEADK